ncbi:MAG TPA: diaminopimelate epimerase [Steroidobacteraceae bacterium]|jgi:diaminopimelate epimerase|nr:diaminopimelate epimerase [Steroidobacteraceae bacterium]
MQLDFTKMHGLGNDFIVFDAPRDGRLPTGAEWRRLSARHTGIGFDQALVIEPPRRSGTDVYYRIFNADGGEVEQCGNGVRCLAAFLHRRGVIPTHGNGNGEIVLDSPVGPIRARVHDGDLVSVDMGVPNFDPKSLPFEASAEAHVYPLAVAGTEVEIGAVSMGNPHAVLTVSSVASAPVDRLGPAIERHPRFPKRVNVGFMEIVDRAHIRLRVFERGVGETLACGTGACGAVAVGRRHGRLDATVEVELPGGKLEITWPGAGEHIWMKGPTAVSFTGRVEI